MYTTTSDIVQYYQLKFNNGEYDFFNVIVNEPPNVYECYLGPDDSNAFAYDYVFKAWVCAKKINATRMSALISNYSGGVKEQSCTYVENTEANRKKYLGK